MSRNAISFDAAARGPHDPAVQEGWQELLRMML
jgi:hypothetical protein